MLIDYEKSFYTGYCNTFMILVVHIITVFALMLHGHDTSVSETQESVPFT